MQCNWLGERVAAPDLKLVMTNLIRKKEAGNWGPNATFKFPARGGTHGIWKAVAKTLPQDKLWLNTAVSHIDPAAKIAYCSNGNGVKYEKIISTMAVDQLTSILLSLSGSASAAADSKTALPDTVVNAAKGLVYSSTHVIGIGMRGRACPDVARMCWMYFPEDNTPFYRATVFSNYSPNLCPQSDIKLKTLRLADGTKKMDHNQPKEGPYWSLMLEICESAHKPVNRTTMMEEAIQGCIKTGLIKVRAFTELDETHCSILRFLQCSICRLLMKLCQLITAVSIMDIPPPPWPVTDALPMFCLICRRTSTYGLVDASAHGSMKLPIRITASCKVSRLWTTSCLDHQNWLYMILIGWIHAQTTKETSKSEANVKRFEVP